MPAVRPPISRLPPREPNVDERIWSMQRAGRWIDCEVRSCCETGWDCGIFDEDWCIYRRRWPTRADALADAEQQRLTLLEEVPTHEPDDLPSAI